MPTLNSWKEQVTNHSETFENNYPKLWLYSGEFYSGDFVCDLKISAIS